MSYDKRYSQKEIERIRKGASVLMFFIMAFLCFAVGKVAYATGYHDGYYERTMAPAAQQSSYNARQTSSNIEIEILDKPQGQTWVEYKRNSLLSYWFWAAIAVGIWAFYKCLIYPDSRTIEWVSKESKF